MLGNVYFVQDPRSQLVKIGYTGRPVANRLRELQVGVPERLSLKTAIRAPQTVERMLHRTFSPLRRHGEWFESCHKLAALIVYLEDCALDEKVTRQKLASIEHDVIFCSAPFHPSVCPAAWNASANVCGWSLK